MFRENHGRDPTGEEVGKWIATLRNAGAPSSHRRPPRSLPPRTRGGVDAGHAHRADGGESLSSGMF
jgi:hypothetical protein